MARYKVVIIAIVLIVMVGLGLWWWSFRPGLPIDDVMPSGALLYGRLTHPMDRLNQSLHSTIGQSIASIDLPKVLARNAVSSEQIVKLQHWQKAMQKFLDSASARAFLDKEAAVGVYPKIGGGQDVLVAVRLGPSASMVEFAAQFSRQWSDDTVIKKENYKGHTLLHVSFKKKRLAFECVRLRDLLLISSDADRIKQAVNVYLHQLAALDQDPKFMVVQQHAYSSAEGLFFINMAMAVDLWPVAADVQAQLHHQAEAFPVYGWSYVSGPVSRYKMIIGLNTAKMIPSLRKMIDCSPPDNDSLKLAPSNAIFYNWSSCYDFQDSWESLKERFHDRPDAVAYGQRIKSILQKRLHLDIERDVLPALGHEMGGYLTGLDTQGLIPLPRLLFFIKIHDRAMAEQFMDKLTQNPIAELKTQDYDHIHIHYLSLPLGINMDPGYCFLGDYLLVASSSQLLKQSIEAYNDPGQSIASDPLIQTFKIDDGNKFRSVTLMKVGELAQSVEDFIGWFNKYLSSRITMAATYQQEGESKDNEIDQGIKDKQGDLKLAKNKLAELKAEPLPDLTVEDPSVRQGEIANLERETQTLRNALTTYEAQKKELAQAMVDNQVEAGSDKLAMFNIENVVSPMLKGLESIGSQAVTVRLKDNVCETEFLVK